MVLETKTIEESSNPENIGGGVTQELNDRLYGLLSLCELKKYEGFCAYHIKLPILFGYIKDKYWAAKFPERIRQAINVLKDLEIWAGPKLCFLVWNYEEINVEKMMSEHILIEWKYSNIENTIAMFERDEQIIGELLNLANNWSIDHFRKFMIRNYLDVTSEWMTKLLAPYEDLLTNYEYGCLLNFVAE